MEKQLLLSSEPEQNTSRPSLKNMESRNPQETLKEEEFVPSKRRWFVGSVIFFVLLIRGYNQSCYGSINDILSSYFHVAPWQVDWITLCHSAIYITATFPLSILTTRIQHQRACCLMSGALASGLLLCTGALALPGAGYPLMVAGQSLTAFCGIFSLSIVNSVAAVWFPSNEAPAVVAVMLVARGTGECAGASLGPALVRLGEPVATLKVTLTILQGSVAILSSALFILILIFMRNAPEHFASRAQQKAAKRDSPAPFDGLAGTLGHYKELLGQLFGDKYFLVLWLGFGAMFPILRSLTILLSSLVHQRVKNDNELNLKSGLALSGAWAMYVLGSLLAGAILRRTKRLKALAVFGCAFQFASCVGVFTGLKLSSIPLTMFAVAANGAFLGLTSVCFYNLAAEVTYPRSSLPTTMLNIVTMGIARVLYVTMGRLLLGAFDAATAIVLPIVASLLVTIAITTLDWPMRRSEAENDVGQS